MAQIDCVGSAEEITIRVGVEKTSGITTELQDGHIWTNKIRCWFLWITRCCYNINPTQHHLVSGTISLCNNFSLPSQCWPQSPLSCYGPSTSEQPADFLACRVEWFQIYIWLVELIMSCFRDTSLSPSKVPLHFPSVLEHFSWLHQGCWGCSPKHTPRKMAYANTIDSYKMYVNKFISRSIAYTIISQYLISRQSVQFN